MLEDASQGTPDVKQTADSSPAQDVKTVAADTSKQTSSQDVTPESSTAQGVKQEDKPFSLKEAISDGLKKMEKESAKDSPPGSKDTEDKDISGDRKDAESEKESEEEKNAPKEINSHPAFKKVVAERTEARKTIRELQSQMEPLKQDAQRYQTLQTFLKTNNVEQKDAAEALKITALASSDPHAFYEKIVTLARQWGEHLGYVLPSDLEKDVSEGIISEQRAAELAKARGQVQVSTMHAQRTAEQMREQAAQQEVQYRVKLFESWSEQTSRTDPDLQKKIPMIVERLRYILETEGDPGTADKAWERLTRAHNEVTERLRSFAPPRPAITPSPRSQGTPAGSSAPPSNYDEAWKAAFSKLR